jgi:hypothetical protein
MVEGIGELGVNKDTETVSGLRIDLIGIDKLKGGDETTKLWGDMSKGGHSSVLVVEELSHIDFLTGRAYHYIIVF